MSYIHLTIEERTSIAYLHNQGVSLRKIAKTIGRNVSTIKRELDRNCTPSEYWNSDYFPHSSQKRYKKGYRKHIILFNFLWKLFKLLNKD